MREEIKPEVQAFVKAHGRPPGLGIVLVGEDPASHVYVRNKLKAAEDVGFYADCTRMAATSTLDDVLREVERLNASDKHDGILVQSPLPKAMGPGAAQKVFDTIAVGKDVDGFAAESIGLLVQNRPQLVACTPAGVIEMLEREKIQIAGTRAVVLGRSDIVGKPMALLLLHRDATVTVCHSRTPDLAGHLPAGGHPGGGRGTARLRHARLREARRDGGGRRHQRGDRPEGGGDALPRRPSTPGRVREEGQRARGRRPPERRSGGRRAHAGASRRGSADDHDADEEHAQGGATGASGS